MTPENLTPFLSRDAQVAQALQMAAQALMAAASALTGEGLPVSANTLSHSLTLPHAESTPVAELINQFLRAKARKDCSDRYLRALRVSLGAFARGRKQADANSVTIEDLEKWLESGGWGSRTRLGYLRDVRTLYNWGLRRGLVSHNPANAVENPQEIEREVTVLSPGQVRQVLEFARGYNLNICRALAIQFFAGLRTAEVERLEEAEINLELGFIEVPARKAKTRQRRPVTIQPNLREWLALGGSLPLHDLSNLWRWFRLSLKKKLGLEWPSNVARHSFCSYHLQHFGNAAKTALEAGHTEQMLFKHYRGRVHPAQAAEYWTISPHGG